MCFFGQLNFVSFGSKAKVFVIVKEINVDTLNIISFYTGNYHW